MSQRKICKVDVTPKSTEFSCSNCHKPAKLRCSRCGSVKYCDVDCQKKNWNTHKIFCCTIKKHRQTVQEKAKILDLNKMNSFKSDVGYFWDIPLARNYCISRRELACALYECGHFNNSKLAYELALEHMLDLIWLCREDTICLSHYIPNIYIVLRRVTDAYNFFKFWNNLGSCYEHDDGFDIFNLFPYLNHQEISASRWRYLLGNIGKEDVSEDLCNLNLNLFTPIEESLSLFLIKYLAMRYAKKYEFNEADNSYQAFLSSIAANEEPAVRAIQNCLPALDLINMYVMVDAYLKVTQLKFQLEFISRVINLRNRYIVPCFVNCPYLFTINESDISQHERLVQEAYNLATLQFFDWFQTPGSLCCLRKRYFKFFGKQKSKRNINVIGKTIKEIQKMKKS